MTTEQKANAIHFLPDLKKIDAIQCSCQYQKVYGVHIDWHEFAYLLDHLHTQGLLKIVEHGMTVYEFSK